MVKGGDNAATVTSNSSGDGGGGGGGGGGLSDCGWLVATSLTWVVR